MKVAIVIPAESDGVELWRHPRFLSGEMLLVEGFAELGHEATIICHAPGTFLPDLPVLVVERSVLGEVGFWRDRRYDLVIVVTFMHSYHAVLASAARSGAFVISRGDTDGLLGVRAHPGATFRHAYHSVPPLIPRLRNVWFWGKKFAYLHREQDRPILTCLEQANATTVETDVAREEVVRFLRRSGAEHLAPKVHVVPPPAAMRFCTPEVASADKDRLVYAVGRWGDPQKNARLLASVLRGYLAANGDVRAVVAGSGGETLEHSVGTSRIEYVGHLDQEGLVALAGRARVCLVTSHWEGCHIGAHEALAMGATVVGTPIPAVRSMTTNGCFGLVASTHRRRDVQAALAAEMDNWERGGRNPERIASHWRGRLSPRAVATRLVEVAAGNAGSSIQAKGRRAG